MKQKQWLAVLLCGVVLTGCASQPIEQGSGSADEMTVKTEVITTVDLKELDGFGGCGALKLPGIAATAVATGSSIQDIKSTISFEGSSEDAWSKLESGELDVILAYAPDTDTEQRLLEQGVQMQEIGTDALVFLTEGAQETRSLTCEQILDAYQHPGGEWTCYASAPKSSADQLFSRLFGLEQAGEQLTIAEDEVLTAACPHTAGTLCYQTYLSMQLTGLPQNTALVAADGILPDASTVLNQDTGVQYPLTVPYYAACRGDVKASDAARLLYDWLTSEDGMTWLAQQMAYGE